MPMIPVTRCIILVCPVCKARCRHFVLTDNKADTHNKALVALCDGWIVWYVDDLTVRSSTFRSCTCQRTCGMDNDSKLLQMQLF